MTTPQKGYCEVHAEQEYSSSPVEPVSGGSGVSGSGWGVELVKKGAVEGSVLVATAAGGNGKYSGFNDPIQCDQS